MEFNILDTPDATKFELQISSAVKTDGATNHFQTQDIVAGYMASLIPNNCGVILEPTPGRGNLVKAVQGKGRVVHPVRFEEIKAGSRFDWAIMNPPFSPMLQGYDYLKKVMGMTDNIIALLPWLIIINSSKRLNEVKSFGLVSVTALPRKAFPGSRVQCCILELKKGFNKETIFRQFDW